MDFITVVGAAVVVVVAPNGLSRYGSTKYLSITDNVKYITHDE